MRRFEWSRVLIALLVVALLSLGGCGGGGGGYKGGDNPAPAPNPGSGGYRLEDFRGEWKAEDAAGTLLMEGSEDSVAGEVVRVKVLPSSQVALSVEYFGSEKDYSSNAFSEARESAANVFVLKFKETGETSGSMTFTVVDSETLKVVETGTTLDRGKVGELRYTLRRVNSALPQEPNPDLNPGPSPAPGGPVDLARLNGNWRPYDGRGTFTGANGEIHKMVLKSTSLLTCTYIRPPSPYAGQVMIMQTLNWASEERGSRRGFKTGHKADTPCRGTKGEYGTKITFEDGSTMEIIDPKTPAYFLIHEKGSLYERGVLYRYDLTYRIERRS